MNLEALEAINLEHITDPMARQGMVLLLNLVEELSVENLRLRSENQQLRDENNRLKGEQGKPDIKPRKNKKASQYDSEEERKRPRRRKKRAKLPKIEIDREEVVTMAESELPEDAEFKGYETVVVQDVKIVTDNVRFQKAKYYSPTERKTYLAPLPPGYEGEFGPGMRSLVTVLYFGSRMTQPAIVEFLANVGMHISAGQLSNLLVHKQERFHAEKQALLRAGLESTTWQLLDSTSMRWDGENVYTHVLANAWYTVFTTKPRKDRQALIEVLQGSEVRSYLLNDEAMVLLEEMRLSGVKRNLLATLQSERMWLEEDFLAYLEQHLPDLGPQQRRQVLDAAAIAAYHARSDWPVIDTLVTDDAREFQYLTDKRALCWVHDGRHYKKLHPVTPQQQEVLDVHLTDYWAFYHRLESYRQQPSEPARAALTEAFDELFTRKTPYWLLNERITLTKAKREALLLVLDQPDLPLHTNQVERDIRSWVRKRKISAGVRSTAGAKAWDTFLSLYVTARKLGVSFYHYVFDRISETYALPSLAQLVTARAQEHPQALAPP